MKTYQNLYVLESGEYERIDIITNKTAKQQGEYLWQETPNVAVVEIKEHGERKDPDNDDPDDWWGEDYYLRTAQ